MKEQIVTHLFVPVSVCAGKYTSESVRRGWRLNKQTNTQVYPGFTDKFGVQVEVC